MASGRLDRAGVFGDHVPGAASGGFVKLALLLFEVFEIHIAERLDREMFGRLLAMRAALVVGRIDKAASGARVEDDNGHVFGEGHGRGFKRAAVDHDGMAVDAGCRNQLVHDTAVHADPLVFRPLCQECHWCRFPVDIGYGGKRSGSGHFERCRRRQPGRQRHVARHNAVPAAEFAAVLAKFLA